MLNLFINTWGNYNENGAEGGRWITLPMDEDELQETLEDIAAKMADFDPEFFINDYEFTCDIDFSVSENESITALNEFMQMLDDLPVWQQETAAAFLELYSRDDFERADLDEWNLLTDVHTRYDLGYYWIEESGCYNLDNLGNLKYYIDYEAFGRDIDIESEGGFTSYGFLYR